LTRAASPRDQRGFILLFVLWTLAVLALLVSRLTASAHSAAGIADSLRGNLVQEANAGSAVYTTAFHLLDRAGTPWDSDGRPHTLLLNGGTVQVRSADEADKVNLNTASADLLRELLIGVGIDSGTAQRLAASIVDWREEPRPPFSLQTKGLPYRQAGRTYAPPGAPFRAIGEVGRVLGMTPEFRRRIRPHITIYSTYGPSRGSADIVVRDAVNRVRAGAGLLPLERGADDVRVIRVVAVAIGPGPTSFTRNAVLRLGKEPPFAILAWTTGDDTTSE
jgi:general secretion pathway protein K